MNVDSLKRALELASQAKGPNPKIDLFIDRLTCGSEIHCDQLDKNPQMAKPFTSSIDATLSLEIKVPWLCPIADWSTGTVRLVNGLGYTVDGDDFSSKGETMCLSFVIAYLKALIKANS